MQDGYDVFTMSTALCSKMHAILTCNPFVKDLGDQAVVWIPHTDFVNSLTCSGGPHRYCNDDGMFKNCVRPYSIRFESDGSTKFAI